jgi:uncharacterized protein
MVVKNRWGFPDLGLGLGLRPVHYSYIFENDPPIDWFEIISENFIDTEGLPLYNLDRVRERYPIVMHGVSLSIGSTDALDFNYLGKIKALAKHCKAVWVGDHVCWTGVNGINGHDLYPMPYNEESLAWVVERIKVVQDFLERPLVLENPSTYLTFKSSTMTEATFIRRMAQESDCALLLDLNNVYVSSRNHDDFDPKSYIEEIPLDRVVQIHLAGHTDKGTHCIDTHNNYVVDFVWQQYSQIQKRTGGTATLLEWDDDIPEFPVVQEELFKAKQYRPHNHEHCEHCEVTSGEGSHEPQNTHA